MRKTAAEPYRDIDFAGTRRGALRPAPSGKTKISIRLDTAILEHFRREAELAGGGSYQSMINDALAAYIQRAGFVMQLRRVVREELRRMHEAPVAAGAPLGPQARRIRSVVSKVGAGKGNPTLSRHPVRLKAGPG